MAIYRLFVTRFSVIAGIFNLALPAIFASRSGRSGKRRSAAEHALINDENRTVVIDCVIIILPSRW